MSCPVVPIRSVPSDFRAPATEVESDPSIFKVDLPAYLVNQRGSLPNTSRVSLYIESSVDRSNRFEPPLSASVSTSKAAKTSLSMDALISSPDSGAFTGHAAREVIDWCSAMALTAVRLALQRSV